MIILRKLNFYLGEKKSLQIKILLRSSKILNIEIDNESAMSLSKQCRGTPRIANRILRRCRDVAQVKGNGIIDIDITTKTLNMLGIDSNGLDVMDRKILETIIVKFNGGPVGLSTIAAAIGEEEETIEEVYEPYLIQEGFLKRTPRGRATTLNAYQALKLDKLYVKDDPQQRLL